jgi:hypothetical protein
MGEGARDLLVILACADCMREASSLLSDLCNFDTFWGSRTDPFLISLADLSTRCCESIVVEATSRWEALASRLRNERMNMVAVLIGSVMRMARVDVRGAGWWKR